MLQSIEAIIDENGVLKLLEPVQLPKSRRVIITILNDDLSEEEANLALLSELALSQDWNRPEEDEAWSHLAELQSL
jgi:predicted DNA-binding antitoxin AbrB/MazE fold protein